MKLTVGRLAAIVVVGLGIAYAAMHTNFVVAYEGQEFRDFDVLMSVTRGEHPEKADLQSRLIFPHLLKAVFLIVPKQSWALFLTEALCSIFAFGAFFLLAEAIAEDRRYALLATLGLAAFAPVCLQLTYRYGELLIVGIYSALAFLAATRRESAFVACLAAAACQRVDVAMGAVGTKTIYSWLAGRRLRAAADAALIAVPAFVGFLIKRHYGIGSETYLGTFFSEGWRRLALNLAGLRQVAMLFLPVWVLAALLFRSFDPRVRALFYGMGPYFVLVSFFGSFTESRLILPFVAVLLVGIARALKDRRLLAADA